MTLPVVPGNSLSFSQVNTELSLSSTATISLNDAPVRTLAAVGASPATIAITNLSGKSNSFPFSISSNQTNANLRTLAINAGWPGTAQVIATINSGIFVYSTSTGTPALTIDGAFPNGVKLTNNGTIQGMGGVGGSGAGSNSFPNPNLAAGSAGSAGGLALSVSVAVTIDNGPGRIAGGGGGGGGGKAISTGSYGKGFTTSTGGGGGGGLGGNGGSGGSGGSGGGWGFPAGTPGGSGSQAANGSGGPAGNVGGPGGAGGSYGAAGSTGGSVPNGNLQSAGPYSGGAGGGAITGNSNITYIAVGTRNGGIS